MKSTAFAPANIAFIKYWGKKDEEIRLPANSSISMNLDKCFTITTVEFAKKYRKDSFEIIGEKVHKQELERVKRHLDKIRKKANSCLFAKVVSKNSFPKKAGMAASASGFAALTVAGASALGLSFSERELSILARLGSGSAARSVPSGFVEWKEGERSEESYAYSLYNENYWDLRDILLITTEQAKVIGSTEGQETSRETSTFYNARIEKVKHLIKKLKKALSKKDFKTLGEIIEKDCLYMHSIMMTSTPALFYWLPKTVEVIRKVYQWRNEGIPVYFTIDAGPNVHLICEKRFEKKVLEKVGSLTGIKNIIINKPAKGAHLIKRHLF